jgi:PAS domain S-box-containing protein
MFISNEELINSISNAIDEGIVLLNEDNKVINLNKGFCKILYKCEHEIINKDFASVIECSDIGAFTKKTINNCIKEVRNYQEKQKTTISLIDKEGKTKNLELLFYPLTFENKRNIVVVVLDITEKKLIEDQLNYIQKMETIGQLAVGIAHDFNNLLTAVIGFASFIERYGFGSLGEYALIKIKDNGCGMDKETLKRVFEPFYTTKEAGKGTGLGMSIVYSIVKQHNGFITVESEKGKGTEVNIYLPLVVEERICEAALKEVFSNIKGGTETILVAEDDEYVRNLIYEVLTKAGYTVVLAKDGDEAVKKFLKMKNNIDLVILDVIMPYKNGGEVFSEISLANPLIKAIFLSGYSLDFINSQLLSSKKVIFMAKPISPKDLLLKVREVLDEVKSC